MATFDQLSAEQRAIIELVLRQGKTYAELSGMLGMPEQRVRDLARDSLTDLAPVSARGVEEDWRGQLADYVLGQQSGSEATATRGHLRRSEPARAWTRSLLDSLDSLYPNGTPQIPDAERGRRREAAGRAPAPEDGAVVLRRRIAAGAGVLLLVLIVAVVLLTGGDDGKDNGDKSGSGTGSQQAAKDRPAGVAVVALQDGKYRLVLTATKLPAVSSKSAYEVWLYNSRGDSKSLGAQSLQRNGSFSGQSQALPRDTFEQYKYIDISREPVNDDAAHSGVSVLRGRLSAFRDATPKAGQAAIVSRALLTPPTS